MRGALGVVLLSVGCVGHAQVGLGAAVDTRDVEKPEVMVVSSAGMAPDADGFRNGLGLQTRSRRGPDGFDASMAPLICHYEIAEESGWGMSACGGASILNVGLRDGEVALGAVSPEASVLLWRRQESALGWMVGLHGGYDVRLTGQGGSPWVGLSLGYGPASGGF